MNLTKSLCLNVGLSAICLNRVFSYKPTINYFNGYSKSSGNELIVSSLSLSCTASLRIVEINMIT